MVKVVKPILTMIIEKTPKFPRSKWSKSLTIFTTESFGRHILKRFCALLLNFFEICAKNSIILANSPSFSGIMVLVKDRGGYFENAMIAWS
jgi:hypothetical protein